ncbi:Wound-induced protein [Macleaya cordata]|uniref:Wound-induced protein n=1 Tax=Macleaya cordata TaxID=56857 RepID=A0A200Q8A9_MACCD|nr:Wound-induced protein [Macleaya cordata]
MTKLANLKATTLDEEGLDEPSNNKRVVWALYEALSQRDVETVHGLLAPNIEWWFHGPPAHQHLMRLLTGTSSSSISFSFVPSSITSFGSNVLVEGCDLNRSVSWVHAWTVDGDGIISQVREYFNTSLTVTRIGSNWNNNQSSSAASSSLTPISLVDLCLWESRLSNTIGKSVPGLLIPI